jgi:hypothetical protein
MSVYLYKGWEISCERTELAPRLRGWIGCNHNYATALTRCAATMTTSPCFFNYCRLCYDSFRSIVQLFHFRGSQIPVGIYGHSYPTVPCIREV